MARQSCPASSEGAGQTMARQSCSECAGQTVNFVTFSSNLLTYFMTSFHCRETSQRHNTKNILCKISE